MTERGPGRPAVTVLATPRVSLTRRHTQMFVQRRACVLGQVQLDELHESRQVRDHQHVLVLELADEGQESG